MAFYTVRLQGVRVAVLQGDTLEAATDLVFNSHQTDALECHVLWNDGVPPTLVPATLTEIGGWAASFEAAVVRGDVDLEHFSYWMLLFGEAEDALRVSPGADKLRRLGQGYHRCGATGCRFLGRRRLHRSQADL